MASNGIRDRVAIVGMGCTPFGEHWDKGVNDLLVDSTKDALASAGIALADVDAFLKDVMTRNAWKNHKNGALNPRAQFRKEVPKETIACSPLVAGPLGIFDCSGVSDGSAAAIIVRAEDAHRYTDKPLYVKALSFVAGPAAGPLDPDYDYTTFPEVVASATDAYAQAGIKDPRQ